MAYNRTRPLPHNFPKKNRTVRRNNKVQALQEMNNIDSRKELKRMREHRYGKEKVNLHGFYNPRKRKLYKPVRVPRGINMGALEQ